MSRPFEALPLWLDSSLSRDDVRRLAERIITWAGSYPGAVRVDPNVFKSPLLAEEAAVSSRSHFSEEKIEEDIRKVANKKKEFLSESDAYNKKRAEALEIIITFFGKTMGWFGQDAYISRTSEYDDWFNGVDGVIEIEFDDGNERVAIVIDASMSSDPEVLNKKINSNIEKVLHPEQSEVKYFVSAKDGKRGSLSLAIPVVIGVDGNHTNDLIIAAASMLTNREKDGKTFSLSFAQSSVLEKHPCQFVFLDEIIAQLDEYADLLAKRNDQRYVSHIATIKKIREYFAKVRKEKRATLLAENDDAVRRDDYANGDFLYQSIVGIPKSPKESGVKRRVVRRVNNV